MDYKADFEAEYGAGSANTFGGHARDAVHLTIRAMEQGGTDRARVRAAFENIRNFVGITGVFDFSGQDHNGLDRRAAAMIEIVDGQWRLAR